VKKLLLLLCVCGCFAITPLFADTFGVNFNLPQDGSTLANGPFTLGWSFTVGNQNLTVTDLGVYDDGGAALLESHAVGIWDSAGNLVTSTTIASGTGATLETDSGGESWRDNTVAPVTLLAGQTYTIGAVWNNATDNLIFSGALFTTSGITFDQNAFIAGGSLTDPTNTTGDTGSYFGPNFEFTTGSTVPEPSSLVLLGIGAFGIGLGAWRKARR